MTQPGMVLREDSEIIVCSTISLRPTVAMITPNVLTTCCFTWIRRLHFQQSDPPPPARRAHYRPTPPCLHNPASAVESKLKLIAAYHLLPPPGNSARRQLQVENFSPTLSTGWATRTPAPACARAQRCSTRRFASETM